jgi:hypothetical protein
MSWGKLLILAAVIYEANGFKYQSWVCFMLGVILSLCGE